MNGNLMKQPSMKRLFALPLILILLAAVVSNTAAIPPDSTSVPETSIYQLTSIWTTHDEATVHLKDLRGQPQLIAMIYMHCGSACPLIVQNMKRVLEQLSAEERTQVGRVLVSIDPERDTPERLREFAKTHNLDLNQWTLLRSTDMNTRELSAVLGVRYQQEASGMFSHSSLITVLDASGVIVSQQEAFNQGLNTTAAALQDLLQSPQ